MRRHLGVAFIAASLLLAACGQALTGRMVGVVTEIAKNRIVASFPSSVRANSMMIVMVGDGEAVAGMAVSEKCSGHGPYTVRGELAFVSDAGALTPGKKVYVNSLNAGAPPSGQNPPAIVQGPVELPRKAGPADRDLKLYYYAAGQTVGYGALGVGYNRTVNLLQGVGVEFDAGVTGVGSVNAQDPDVIDTDQLIKSLSGRLKLDFAPAFGAFAGYRWSQARGDDDHWSDVTDNLRGKTFAAPSDQEPGTVLLQGIEYGLTLSPSRTVALSLGYIPKLRADYGGLGVRSEPAYTGELRFSMGRGLLRLRGIRSDNYWLADLGVTIR